ncbi:MAG: DUF927 domain-containing protein [Pseudomonadota bacterium]
MNAHSQLAQLERFAKKHYSDELSRRQFYMITYFLLAEWQERIDKRTRLEVLRKVHFYANLFRRRRNSQQRFSIEYIKYWSIHAANKWLQYYKNLRPAINIWQAISVKNPLHPANAFKGIGADVNRTIPVIGTPMPVRDDNSSHTQSEHHKVLVLQGAPTCGTKKIFFDADGNPQKSGARQQTLFAPSQFKCNDIQSLAEGLRALESQPDKFIIHGQPREPLTGEKINRRKYEHANANMPPSIQTGGAVPFFTADIDNLQLVDLGYHEKTTITDVSIEQLVDKITEKFLPNFRDVSYYAQFSSSCGWKVDDQKTIKIHIWWWLESKIEIAAMKKIAKRINQTVGFQLLDTAIYQETQPIYIAAPIFPQGTPDHLRERSKMVVLPKASARLEDAYQASVEERENTKSKPGAKKPDSLQAWTEFFGNLGTETSLHDNLLAFFFWAIKAKISESDFNQIKAALGNSPRMKKKPARLSALLNGEWDQTLDWCKSRETEKEDALTSPLPPGYIMKKGGLHVESVTRNDKLPFWKLVYAGIFRVIGFHRDMDTLQTFVELQIESFDGIRNITVPQSALATKNTLIKTLSNLGAFISDKNAQLCLYYLDTCFQQDYRQKLSKKRSTNRLGFHGDSFVLPDVTIGGDTALEYKGDLSGDVEDRNIYANAVRTIFNEWGDDAWVTTTALGFSLASPFIKKFNITRNPILVLTGESGSGKSTLLRFAIGAWASNIARPFVLEGSVPNTPIGFAQNVAGLNGLPCFFDEINRAETHRGNAVRWGDAAMAFANGQTRIRGSKQDETQAQGGDKVTGTLFGAGESLPECRVPGVYNRLFLVNATENQPLGLSPSLEGTQRAQLLEKATEQGGGILGSKFVEFVSNHWDEFHAAYKKLRKEWEWRFKTHTDAICLVVTVLRFLCRLLNISETGIIDVMIDNFVKLFCDFDSKDDHPANQAMETIRGMIASSREETRWEAGQLIHLEYFNYKNVPFFWKSGDNYAIPATSDILKRELGDIKPFYQKWIESGFILPGKDGKSTQAVSSKIGPNSTRCLVIPAMFFEDVLPSSDEKNEVAKEATVTPVITKNDETQKDSNNKTVPSVIMAPKTSERESPPSFVEQLLEGLRKIYRNRVLLELPDILTALERLLPVEFNWEWLEKRLADYQTGVTAFKKEDFLRSIASELVFLERGCPNPAG